jgi:hypothetical protein
MNTMSITYRTGFVLLLAIGLLAGAFAAQRENDEAAPGMMDRCKEMMQMRQKMLAGMKEQDAELQNLAAKMRQAQGQQKIELMSDIVARMVEQRSAMHQRMFSMQERMMQHMGQHMQMGPKSMMKCPMMQQEHGHR